jgi:hypothetical protein
MSNLGMGRKLARVGGVLFAAAIAMASGSGEAAAKHLRHLKRIAHHKTLSLDVQEAQAAMNESSHLGAMHYYGGPKSPMWREVR